MSNPKSHKVLDHPILGYFLLMVFVWVFVNVFSILDSLVFARLIEGYGTETVVNGRTVTTASGIGVALGSLTVAMIFFMWFRPGYDGIFKKKGFVTGLIMILPFLLVHWAGSVVSWLEFGTASVIIALLRATAPGFSEEIMFRGLGVANYMRTIKSSKQITFIMILSSVVFGLVHVGNVFAGAELKTSIIQAAYAGLVGVGLFGIYIRTGSLWPSILAHFSVDAMEFIRGDLGASNGVMVSMGVGDWITIGSSFVSLAIGLYLIRPSKHAEIMELWAKKWNKEQAPSL